MTKEERQEKLEAAHAMLAGAVEGLQSGDDWKAMLEVAGRFHKYSAGNVFMILAQRPTASRVAGFNDWKKFNRHVVKGEHGIRIFAPLRYTVKGEDEDGKETKSMAIRGFTLVSVFDVEQTDGEELPDVAPVELDGYGVVGLWEKVSAAIRARGYEVSRGEMPGAAYGYTDHLTKRVVVKDHMNESQSTKTLIHELAHVVLHPSLEEYRRDRERCEVEAESVAFLVAAQVGLVTDGYSFPYVARWAAGDGELVQKTADRAIKGAKEILEVLDGS